MTDSAQPQRLYLLGHPIAHSKSPVMYNAVYGRAGLPWTYGLADCATEDEAQAFLDARDFLSVNVTTPYKPHAYRAATARAASAKLAQGANVLVRKGDALIAYNTDGQGCVAYLERMGVSFAGKRVTVCGTGPTALSIVHACATAGADVVLLLGRDKERARRVLEDFVSRFGLLATATVDLPAARPHHRSFRAAYERTTFKFGSYATSTKALSSSDLVINATPLGMRGPNGVRRRVRARGDGFGPQREGGGVHGLRRRRHAGRAGRGHGGHRVRRDRLGRGPWGGRAVRPHGRCGGVRHLGALRALGGHLRAFAVRTAGGTAGPAKALALSVLSPAPATGCGTMVRERDGTTRKANRYEIPHSG